MAGEINYKAKYNELKAKYMNAVDMAFRLGVEEGMKQSQLDQANQQLQQAQAEQEAAAGGMQPGEEGQDANNNGAPGAPNGGGPDMSGAPSVQPPQPGSENPEGSELDQHIAKLESMVSKSELPMDDLKKSIEDLKSFRVNLKLQSDLKKSAQAIPAIAHALHKPSFKLGVQASHNLDNTAKAAASMHHKVVADVMTKWEQEEQKASKDILSTLRVEGITKGE